LAGALLFDEKIRQRTALHYFGLDCGMLEFFTYEPKTNCCLSRIFGAQLGRKDSGLYPYKSWSKQAGELEAFLYLAAQSFELFLNMEN
jgi:hypothetical protein